MDKDAVNLTKAIRQQESGGKFDAYNPTRTSYGAYQWENQPNRKSTPLRDGEIPTNFKYHAKEILGDENAPMTPENQNAVAYGMVKKWKDSNLNVAQIAAKWNSGSEIGWENKIKKDASGKEIYNTPQYIKNVTSNYQKLKSENVTQSPQGNMSYNPNPFSNPEAGNELYNKNEINNDVKKTDDESLRSKLNKRATSASKSLSDMASGKINAFSGLLQPVGQLGGAVGDIAESGLNFLTGGLLRKGEEYVGDNIIKPLAETQTGQSIIGAGQDFAKSHPELAGDIGAVGNIATALPVFKGVSLAGSAAKGVLEKTFAGATERAIEKELTSAAMRTVGGRKALANVGKEEMKLLAKKEIAPVVDEAGKYTTESIQNSSSKLDDMISHIEDNELQPLLEKGNSPLISHRVPLEEYKNFAIQSAKESLKSTAPVEEYFSRIKGLYGDYPTIGQLNQAKRTVARNITEAGFNSPTYSTDKLVRDTLQKSVEDGAKALKLGNVNDINKKMGNLIKAQKFLDSIENKKANMGFIRKSVTNAKPVTKGLIKSGFRKATGAALTGLGIAGGEKLLR